MLTPRARDRAGPRRRPSAAGVPRAAARRSRRGATRCRCASVWVQAARDRRRSRCGGATRSATCSRSCSWGAPHAQLASLMHEAAHRLLFANRRVNDFVGRWLLGYPSLHVDRRVPPRAHGAPPPGVRARRARHPALRGLPDQPGQLPPQAGARRDRADRVQALPPAVRRVPLVRRRASGTRCGRSCSVQAVLLGRRDRRRRLVGVPGVLGAAVPDRVAGDQPAALDRRARRHGRVDRPACHHALGPPVVVVAHRSSCPFHIGWHLAHHVDAGVSMRHLPEYHRALRESGYVTPGLEFPTYRARCWRALRNPNPAGNRAAGRRVRKLRAWSSGSRTLAAW